MAHLASAAWGGGEKGGGEPRSRPCRGASQPNEKRGGFGEGETFRIRGRCVLGKGRSFGDKGMVKEIHYGDRMMGKKAKILGKGDNKEGEKFWG